MADFIDLNADLGEGDYHDVELLTLVSSCNIACGGHAGDVQSMNSTVAMAIASGVSIGAHPSYPDRDGFGRRSRFLTDSTLRSKLVEQIRSLRVIADERGASVTHVKPHGALYNDAAVDSQIAADVASAVVQASPGAALVGLPASELEFAARSLDLPFISEAFMDRAYRDDGQLVPRGQLGAVLSDVQQIVAQAVSLATENKVETHSKRRIDVAADTLCVHGDTPGAARIALAVRDELERRGVEIRAIGGR